MAASLSTAALLLLSLAVLRFVPRDEAAERRRDHAIGLTGGVL